MSEQEFKKARSAVALSQSLRDRLSAPQALSANEPIEETLSENEELIEE